MEKKVTVMNTNNMVLSRRRCSGPDGNGLHDLPGWMGRPAGAAHVRPADGQV